MPESKGGKGRPEGVSARRVLVQSKNELWLRRFAEHCDRQGTM